MADDFLGPMNPIRSPEAMQNLDILDLCYRLDSYMHECGRCASSSRNETSEHDLKRLLAMINRFEERFDTYAGSPELDLPKYHPEPLRMPAPPALNRVQNTDIQHMLNVFGALRIELAFSDSAERSTGFKEADGIRLKTVVQKCRQVHQGIVDNPEIDLPDVDTQEPPTQTPLR